MTNVLKPIYLLADSQVLFSAENGRSLLHAIHDAAERARPTAAYVGAANGDDPAYYSIFESAMDLAAVADRRMIRTSFPSADALFLEAADIILLAGGDVRRGWQAMEDAGMVEVLRNRYTAGAVLVGISAGAVLLGEKGWSADDPEPVGVFDALGLVPFAVDAHDEANEWRRLRLLVSDLLPYARAIGLPRGSGLVCHSDSSLEPIRRPVVEFATGRPGDAPTLLLPRSGEP